MVPDDVRKRMGEENFKEVLRQRGPRLAGKQGYYVDIVE